MFVVLAFLSDIHGSSQCACTLRCNNAITIKAMNILQVQDLAKHPNRPSVCTGSTFIEVISSCIEPGADN
jgi:hypothetical protein